MDEPREYAIGEVADLAHTTVRTLHHYEQIKLLVPSRRTPAGHRRYSDADVDRLRDVLLYRELEFNLDQIRQLVDDPADADDRLRSQHRLLRERIHRNQHLSASPTLF